MTNESRQNSATQGKRPLVSLAPLAGISDWPFRLLCFEQGADQCVTEMISAQGYLLSPDNAANRFIMQRHPREGPVIAQIFGHRPEYMFEAARRISDLQEYAGIDINMGCPAPKVTNGGSGSALMKDLQKAASVIRAVRAGSLLPLSIKMRIGWDDRHLNAVPFAQMAENEGVDTITVHGRTRSQQYAGKADWQAIAEVKQAVRVPVIANGDVFTARDAGEILRVTGCDGIAVGRGALGNPWLFGQIKRGGVAPAAREVILTALRHAEMMSEWKGERTAAIEMRKHFAWYLKGMKGAAAARARLNAMSSLREIQAVFADFLTAASD